MKKYLKILAAAALIVCFVSAAFAAKNIEIKNNTGIAVAEIYLSGAGSDDWEEDILGDEILNPGETWEVGISGSYPLWDLKLVGENGAEAIFYNINFNKFTKVTLNKDGRAVGQ